MGDITMRSTRTAPLVIAALAGLLLSGLAWAQEEPDNTIEPQPLTQALAEFADQTGMQLVYPSALTAGVDSQGASTEGTPDEILDQLLASTGLDYEYVNDRTIAIAAQAASDATTNDPGGDSDSGNVRPTPILMAQNQTRRNSSTEDYVEVSDEYCDKNLEAPTCLERTLGIPEIIVRGTSQNVDIRRTRDDPQPYVVFSADQLENSQATNIEEFLRTRLPMNTQQGVTSQQVFGEGNRSQFNLRGLGTNQTLVLVDGRRMPGTYGPDSTGTQLIFNQPDLNGISMTAIDRIEVLPATASGIYGGGATGGVINVILKRDFSGFELKGTYENTFESDASNERFDIAGGMSFREGHTNIFAAASYSDGGALLVRERDFSERARALLLANNPDQFFGSSFVVPLGYTTNILNTTPDNLVLEDGNIDLGSPFTFVPPGYTGPASDNGAAFIANAGQYDLDIPNDPRGQQQALTRAPQVRSVGVNARHLFTDRFEAFLDVAWRRNRGETYNPGNVQSNIVIPSTAPNNPFTTDIRVTHPVPGLAFSTILEDESTHAVGGVIMRLPNRWSAEADYVWSRVETLRTTTAEAFTLDGRAAFSNGLLNVLQDVNAYPLDYSPYLLPSPNQIVGPTEILLKDSAVRISGPLASLSGGSLTLTGLISYRKEEAKNSFSDLRDPVTLQPIVAYDPARSQSTNSYSLELRAPLFSRENAKLGLRSLDIQLAIRHDEYTTRSVGTSLSVPSRNGPLPDVAYTESEADATKYTVGLRYAPIDDLVIRTSYGTGFLPPSIGQIVANPSAPVGFFSFFTFDPKRGSSLISSSATWTSGGNPDLLPEESTSFSAGLVYTPDFLPSFRFSADYTRIRKTQEIVTLQMQDVINLEDALPGRVTRGPNLPGDLPGWAGPITNIDATLVNISKTEVDAYDFQIDYEIDTERFGNVRPYLIATYMPEFARQAVPTSPFVNSAGFAAGQLEWKGNAGVTWIIGSWVFDWNVQYYSSYYAYSANAPESSRDGTVLSQGSATIPSQTYHDIHLRYSFDESPRLLPALLSDSEITAGIQNIFDTSPPIIATSASVGGYSTYGDPRLRRFSVSWLKRF